MLRSRTKSVAYVISFRRFFFFFFFIHLGNEIIYKEAVVNSVYGIQYHFLSLVLSCQTTIICFMEMGFDKGRLGVCLVQIYGSSFFFSKQFLAFLISFFLQIALTNLHQQCYACASGSRNKNAKTISFFWLLLAKAFLQLW
jgi:hypothetical protein